MDKAAKPSENIQVGTSPAPLTPWPAQTGDGVATASPDVRLRPNAKRRWLRLLGCALMMLSGLGLLAVMAVALGVLPTWEERLPDRDPDGIRRARANEPKRRRHGVAPPTIRVCSMSFSSDGQRILTQYEADGNQMFGDFLRRLTVWDAQSGEELWSAWDPDEVHDAIWLPGTRHIFLTDWNKQLSIWDADKGAPSRFAQPLREFGEDSKGQWARGVSADGQRVLVQGEWGGDRLWDVARGKQLPFLHNRHGVANHAALSADGKRALGMFSPHGPGFSLALLDVDRGVPLHIWELKSSRSPGMFTPDGKAVISGIEEGEERRSRLVMWDPETGKELWKADYGFGWAFSPEGKHLLVLDEEGLRRVELSTGKSVQLWKAAVVEPKDNERASAYAFSPDRTRLVLARGRCDGGGALLIRLEEWDARTGKMLRLLPETHRAD